MKRLFILIFLVVFFVPISLAACTTNSGIQGTLTDKDNHPLTNIKVSLKLLGASSTVTEQTVYTDSKGFFLFQNQDSGRYLLTVLWDTNPSCPDLGNSLPLAQIDDFFISYADNALGHIVIATSEFDYTEGDRQILNLLLPCSGQSPNQTVSLNSVTEGNFVTDLELSTYDNNIYSMSDFQGKVLVINFWSSWDISSSQLALILEEVSQKYHSQNVVFFGVNYLDIQSDALTFITKYGITYDCGPDINNNLSTKFGIKAVPETIVIDKSGLIVKILHGTKNITVESLSELIEPLIK